MDVNGLYTNLWLSRAVGRVQPMLIWSIYFFFFFKSAHMRKQGAVQILTVFNYAHTSNRQQLRIFLSASSYLFLCWNYFLSAAILLFKALVARCKK